MADIRITGNERRALRDLVEAIEYMMVSLVAADVGRIADYVGENGVDSDNLGTDAVVLESLRLIINAKAKR